METIQKSYPAVNPAFADLREFKLSPEWTLVSKTASILPEPLSCLINSLGILKHGDDTYMPVMANDLVSQAGLFIPSPGTVLLSNLRNTVTALSSAQTPRAVRDSFFHNNPIPGCRFTGRIMQNADEIIPDGYTSEHLYRDIAAITNVLLFVEKHIPKLIGNAIDYGAPGQPSMLLSNNMGDLRCPPFTEEDLQTLH